MNVKSRQRNVRKLLIKWIGHNIFKITNNMIERPLISIVIPEYNGAGMVRELVERIKKSVSVISDNFEIILVNDASPDNAWDDIRKIPVWWDWI